MQYSRIALIIWFRVTNLTDLDYYKSTIYHRWEKQRFMRIIAASEERNEKNEYDDGKFFGFSPLLKMKRGDALMANCLLY